MDNLTYVLFICVVAPLLLTLFVLDRKAKRAMGFILIGMLVCLFVSEVNGLISRTVLGENMFYLTTSITPVTEEIVKAIPVVFFALVFSDDIKDLAIVSFCTGIGFAVLENLVILTQNIQSVGIFWAVIRGFSSGLMHGICTLLAGICLSMLHRRKKLFYCGMFALLNLAIVYHAIFNCLVQASSKVLNYVGFALPILTYIVIILKVLNGMKAQKDKAAHT